MRSVSQEQVIEMTGKVMKKSKPIAVDLYGHINIWKHTKEKDGDYVHWSFDVSYGDPTVRKSKIYYYTNGTPYFVAICPWARNRKEKLTDFVINDKDLLKLTWYAGWQ